MRILITGGTSGIGRSVALLLGRRGVDVDVIGGRDEAKGADLTASFEGLPATLRFFPADLSTLEGINRVLDGYLARTETLDAAFLNAGTLGNETTLDDKGRGSAFIVNYLHRFIFARRLNAVLRTSSAPRILINGSSNRALGINLDPAVFGRSYGRTKGMVHALAANGFLTYWLNRRFDTGVPVQAIDPGFVDTGMVQRGGFFLRLLSRWFAVEPDKVAEKIVDVLLDDQAAARDGAYFTGGRNVGFRKGISEQPEKFDRIWQLSLELAEMPE